MIDEALRNLQKVERENMGREEVTMKARSNDPLLVLCASDLHAGALATDGDMIDYLRDLVLSQPNAGVVLLGDEVEGLKEAYLNTNTARTPIDFTEQIDYMRGKFLEPLASQGRILAMVSGYWGHPGWAEDATTINTWRIMTDGLNIPILQNGGRLNVKFPNGHVQSMRIWHNPPGSSKTDPVYGLRNAAFQTSESSRTDGYMNGHIHRVAVGKEIYSGSKTAVYYISSGTAKGSSGEIAPDRFGVKLGLPRTDTLGQGVVLQPRSRNQDAKNFPFVSFGQGKMAFQAIELLNKVEQQGMTAELLDKIRAEVEAKPKISLIAGKSRVSGDEQAEEKPVDKYKVGGEWVENPYSKMRMRAPYDSLTYDIETQLPIALHLVSNARLGSSSEGYPELKRYQQELIAGNPHSLVVYLRNMIDRSAGKSDDRIAILNKFAGVINGASEQTLAIMMCESLRDPSWAKKIKTGEEEYEDEKGKKHVRFTYEPPIAPGSYLANQTDTPLIHHLSLIKLAVGPRVALKEKPLYVGAFADKLMHHGSFSRPEFGLRRMYDLYTQEKPGYVAGGHMPHAGSMMFYDRSNAETKSPILVAPGWFAKYVDTMGTGNVMPGAEPGQAIIFMPGATKGEYMAFPTVNENETGYMQDALTLLKGLEILGLTEQVLGKKGRK